ncbi:hypothetical protein DFJ73DRAFT_779568 [Zopfochytrium polystomum]|nr:hypothetical protein DFJ73DRAFT_779568 [Zopfochytrium polystomum]
MPCRRRRTTTTTTVALAVVARYLLAFSVLSAVLLLALLTATSPPPFALAASTSSTGTEVSNKAGKRRFSDSGGSTGGNRFQLADKRRLFIRRFLEDRTGTTETVGGVTVAIGEKVKDQGKTSTVYHAKHGNKDVIYKQDSFGSHYGGTEVEATKAAGQFVAVQDSRMVQKKVGSTGLKNWLQTQKDSPAAKSSFLLKGENPKDHPAKTKLSEAIYSQVEKNQKDAGFLHKDVQSGNIRVHASPSDKPVGFAQRLGASGD